MTARKAKDRPDKRSKISARLRKALDLMCWGDADGNPLDWDVAARTANISTRSMRRSLERPVVRQYLKEQKQVLRACISAKSLARLDELAAQRSNMNAAVNAIRVIDEAEENAGRSVPSQAPGITIRLVNVVADTNAAPATIEAKPVAAIDHHVPELDADGRILDPILRRR